MTIEPAYTTIRCYFPITNILEMVMFSNYRSYYDYNQSDDFIPYFSVLSENKEIIYNSYPIDGYTNIREITTDTKNFSNRYNIPAEESIFSRNYTMRWSSRGYRITSGFTPFSYRGYNYNKNIRVGVISSLQRIDFIRTTSTRYSNYKSFYDRFYLDEDVYKKEGIDVYQSTTSNKTGLTNDMDEFTISFTISPRDYNINSYIGFGDFFEIINGDVYIFGQYIDNCLNILYPNIDYYKYKRSGERDGILISNINIIYLVTIRYNYGELTVDTINLSLNDDYIHDYSRNRNTLNINLKSLKDVNVSNFQFREYNTPENGGFGYFDFKDRFVEDFLLYDFQNGLHKYGGALVTSIY